MRTPVQGLAKKQKLLDPRLKSKTPSGPTSSYPPSKAEHPPAQVLPENKNSRSPQISIHHSTRSIQGSSNTFQPPQNMKKSELSGLIVPPVSEQFNSAPPVKTIENRKKVPDVVGVTDPSTSEQTWGSINTEISDQHEPTGEQNMEIEAEEVQLRVDTKDRERTLPLSSQRNDPIINSWKENDAIETGARPTSSTSTFTFTDPGPAMSSLRNVSAVDDLFADYDGDRPSNSATTSRIQVAQEVSEPSGSGTRLNQEEIRKMGEEPVEELMDYEEVMGIEVEQERISLSNDTERRVKSPVIVFEDRTSLFEEKRDSNNRQETREHQSLFFDDDESTIADSPTVQITHSLSNLSLPSPPTSHPLFTEPTREGPWTLKFSNLPTELSRSMLQTLLTITPTAFSNLKPNTIREFYLSYNPRAHNRSLKPLDGLPMPLQIGDLSNQPAFGRDRLSCLVTYTTREDAEKSITIFNGRKVFDRALGMYHEISVRWE
jgi:hypothetical protein